MKPSTQQIVTETRSFFQKVYGWMFLGLCISGITAYVVGNNQALYTVIIENSRVFNLLIIGELVLVLGLVGFLQKISANWAIVMFLFYCFMTGLTLSVIFLVYTAGSIGLAFFVSAGMFGVMSIYGYFTKADLTQMGQMLIMGLWGIIIAMIANMFMRSAQIDYIISFIAVIVFTGLTAYDTQKIKEANIIGNDGSQEDTKESIMGALRLYLDFINLFLSLLRIFGKRK